MAAPAVASAVEENIRTVAQTKRIRVNEFFQDYDKLRSGFVSGNCLRLFIEKIIYADLIMALKLIYIKLH